MKNDKSRNFPSRGVAKGRGGFFILTNQDIYLILEAKHWM